MCDAASPYHVHDVSCGQLCLSGVLFMHHYTGKAAHCYHNSLHYQNRILRPPPSSKHTQKNTLTHKDNNKNNIILIDDVQVVLSSAFSPTHWLLATGCLSGRLVWHQPVI